MKHIYRFIYLLTGIFCTLEGLSQDTTQHFVEGRRNAPGQIKKPYVILISADGFRYDFIDKYPAKNLLRLSASGVRSTSMIPSFPSVTFPNHYTIATGLYPSHHGIVYNQFYDRKRMASYAMGDRKAVEDGTWYGGTPLWVLAEQQQLLSASYHFVGTEAAIRGLYPSYWYRYSDGIDLDLRIATVVNWLKQPEETRPHFITFYMSHVDHAGHSYGPDAMETRKAVELVDQTVGKLEKEISRLGLPVNFVFVSDHGMAAVDTVYRMDPVVHVDTAQFIIKGGGTTIHLYAKSGVDLKNQITTLRKNAGEYDVYTRDQLPAHWHYSEKDDRFNRMGDIILIPRYPKVFSTGNRRITPGAHGFDTKIREMHATFLAWGPAFKKGLRIPSFENIHIYPMICELLGLTYDDAIDGKGEVLRPILKQR